MAIHGNKALLVEDSPEAAGRICALLEKSDLIGHDVELAGTLQEAVDRLTEKEFDLVLLDLGLPDSEGMETLRKVKAVSGNAAIVVESACSDEDMAVRAIREGAQDYVLNTEVNQETLLRTVRFAMERMKSTGEPNLRLSHQQAVEYELAHDQKLKSIGSLAAGIAHEINTPTQYVSDNTQFLKDAFQDLTELMEKYKALACKLKEPGLYAEILTDIDEFIEDIDVEYLNQEIPKSIEQSLGGLDRISTIVNAMRDYSHPEMKEKKASDINKIINNSITVGRSEWKYHADMTLKLDENLPQVICHSGEVSQVILNMVINSAHAIEEHKLKDGFEHGKIRITTSADNGWVEIRIADDGVGIPEAVREQVFDPFFTTKEEGRGTGQGLAIARKVVVDKHGGTIAMDSEYGKGTTFTLRLPVSGGEELGKRVKGDLVEVGKI